MKKYLKFVGMILAIIIVISMAGCASIVSLDDFESLESQVDDLESQVDDLEDALKDLEDVAKETLEDKTDEVVEKIPEENDDTSTKVSEEPEEKKETDPSGFSESTVLDQLEIIEYSYVSDYNSYVFLAIKNNSDFDITIYGEIIFKNEDGALVGTTSNEERAFESGQEIILDFYSDADYVSYEYSLTVDMETYYDSVLSLLTSEVSITDSKAILAVTNNGDKPAEFVEFTVLFFDGDTLVDYEWGFCTDDDSEIKPGKTNYDEATTYESFDSVLLFLSGRSSKE